MSRSVDLFIGTSLPIAELADLLGRRSGAQLVPTIDPDRWRYIEGSVTAELFEHPYVDDGELWLSRYRYVLSARMADGVGPIDSAEVLGLRHLAQLLHDPVELPVLLVLDLQYRLGPPVGRAVEVPEGSGSPLSGGGLRADGPPTRLGPDAGGDVDSGFAAAADLVPDSLGDEGEAVTSSGGWPA
jgi:hypothetical protein